MWMSYVMLFYCTKYSEVWSINNIVIPLFLAKEKKATLISLTYSVESDVHNSYDCYKTVQIWYKVG